MFHSQYEKWMNGPLLEVNAEDVEEEVSIASILLGYIHTSVCWFVSLDYYSTVVRRNEL